MSTHISSTMRHFKFNCILILRNLLTGGSQTSQKQDEDECNEGKNF